MSYNVKGTIDKLIRLTKSGNISWDYLDTNDVLDSLVNDLMPMTYSTDTSFYSSYGSGYFVICEDDNNEQLYIIAVPDITSRDNCCLNEAYQYQESLLRLHNLIKAGFPNTQDFLDSFLSDES